jgi:mono/diheme cytochrome c family protein
MKGSIHWLMVVALVAATLAMATVSARATDLTAAKKQYANMCAGCHGATGGGNGAAAAALTPKPTNFTDCAAMGKVSDDTLFKATKDGGAAVGLSAMMPPQKASLNDAQIKDMVAYIRSFCKH